MYSSRRQVSRRTALRGLALAVFAVPLGAACGRAADQAAAPASTTASPTSGVIAYTGCRTTAERNGHGTGIGIWRVDPGTGEFTSVQTIDQVNPTWLTFDRAGRHLYAVHGDFQEVTAYRIDDSDGRLTRLNTVSSGGINPVHVVALDDRTLAVANFEGGNLALLGIADDGTLVAPTGVLPLSGTPGPVPEEQTSSHPHQVVVDPRDGTLLVPDLGFDQVVRLRQDGGTLSIASATATRPGAGPRHAALHPALDRVYVVNELDSTVTTYSRDGVALRPDQVLPTLPDGFTGENTCAEIVVSPDGGQVYVLNRGHDSIVRFTVDPATGLLGAPSWTPAGGKGPRFFTLDPTGAWLFCANERSDSITRFRRDAATGSLTPVESAVATGSPVCLVFRTP